ncbi:UNVERIFIED_CONTAM: hypothetical protein FKN15_007476 [Acipenser sinensis]
MRLRLKLAEQLKSLDLHVEMRVQLLQDLSEFFRRKAEIETEYSRGLEKLAERFSSKIRNSKEHQHSSSGQLIPLVVESCIRFINLHGLQHEGIFRVPGSQLEVNEIRNAFERGEDPLTDSTDHDIDSVAGVLKLYFRGLEKPLFPQENFQELMECVQIENKLERACQIKKVVGSFPQAVLVVMRFLFAFLNHLSQYSDENMMDPHNLAVCFGPTLVAVPADQDAVSVQAHVNEAVKTIIVYQEKIFPGARELEGPIYEKCMTGEEEYCDSVLPEPIAEECDPEQELPISEDAPISPLSPLPSSLSPSLSQYSDENMMDPHNLAVCFGPTLVAVPADQDAVSVQAHVNEAVKTIIVYQEKIFPGARELEGPIYEKCMTGEEEYCTARRLELKGKKEEGRAASVSNLSEEPKGEAGSRLRVNSDSASLPRKRSGSSPTRKLTSPFNEPPRMHFPGIPLPAQGRLLALPDRYAERHRD